MTEHDSNELSIIPRGVYVGQTGDIVAIGKDGVEVTFINATAGTLLPIRPLIIKSTDTSASDLVGLY